MAKLWVTRAMAFWIKINRRSSLEKMSDKRKKEGYKQKSNSKKARIPKFITTWSTVCASPSKKPRPPTYKNYWWKNIIENMHLFLSDWLVLQLSLALSEWRKKKAETTFETEKSSFCNQNLFQTFTKSTQGTPAARLMTSQNPDRISLMPAIC